MTETLPTLRDSSRTAERIRSLHPSAGVQHALLLLSLVAATGVCSISLADDLTHQYFERLRQRGLYALGEEYALSHLMREDLPPDRRAVLTVELSRTLIEHGSLADADQRRELWQEGQRHLQELLDRDPRNPRRSQVEAQLAMLPALQGATLAWDVSLTPEDREMHTRAQRLLQTAISGLKNWLDEHPLRRRRDVELADGAMTASESLLLERRVRLQLGQAQLLLAELLSSGAERTAAALDAAEILDQLARTRVRDDVVFEGVLLRARVGRLQRDDDRAASLLDSLLRDESDPLRQDRVLAERIRLELSRKELDEALELVKERVQSGLPLSDELRASVVDLLLEAWQMAGDRNQPDFQEELLEEARSHHERTGGRWRQQATASLQKVLERKDLGDELAAVAREARWLYHRGEVDAALERYGEAAGLAHREGRTDRAVGFAFTRASILFAKERWSESAAAFDEIVDRYRDHDRAADADLLRCHSLGRQFAAASTQGSREAYEAGLQRHRERFATSPTYFEATWRLAVHQEQRSQWTAALPLYQEIAPEHGRHDEASFRILVLYEKILQRLRSIGRPLEDWEDRAAAEIDRIAARLEGRREDDSEVQCRTLLHAAQLLLQHRERPYARADELLARAELAVRQARKEAERRDKRVSPEWQRLDHAIAQTRIVSLGGQQRLGRAREILDRLGETDPSEMLQILLGLTELASKVDPQRQAELGRLQQSAVRKLEQRRHELTAEQQRLLDESTAEAYLATGDLPEAAQVYEGLLKQSPRDRRLIRSAIRVYEQRGQSGDLRQAKGWWIKLERLEKPGSPGWIEARLGTTRLMVRLGEHEQARKLVGVTKTIYPHLGNAALKEEFEELSREIERASN